MPKKAHREEQIGAELQQGQTGKKVADICRKVGINEGAYYAWKKQFLRLFGRASKAPACSRLRQVSFPM